jgi:hypothetical protein
MRLIMRYIDKINNTIFYFILENGSITALHAFGESFGDTLFMSISLSITHSN